jgi:hypothetical protein
MESSDGTVIVFWSDRKAAGIPSAAIFLTALPGAP